MKKYQIKEEIKLEITEMDDYKKASAYLIGLALAKGAEGGFMLRAIKTLMEKVSNNEVESDIEL